MIFKIVLTFESEDEVLTCDTIYMKVIEQYFFVLFILYKDEIL